MTVSSTNLASALAAGEEQKRTPGQLAIQEAKTRFGEARGGARTEYLQQKQDALLLRAKERVSEAAAREISLAVGGGIDLPTEVAALQTALDETIRARVEFRTNEIKTQREQQHSNVLDTAIAKIEGKIRLVATNTETDLTRIKGPFLRAYFALIAESDEILTGEVLAVFGNNKQEAIDTLANRVLAKFKPRLAESAT